MKSTKLTKQSILVDASAVIAGFSANDALRFPAVPIWQQFLAAPYRLFIPFEVIVETLTRIKQKGSVMEAIQLYGILSKFQTSKKISILWPSSKTYSLAIEIFGQNPAPKTFSFTDANILAHMKINNIPTLFTFDRDFKNLGVKIVPSQSSPPPEIPFPPAPKTRLTVDTPPAVPEITFQLLFPPSFPLFPSSSPYYLTLLARLHFAARRIAARPLPRQINS